MHFPNGVQQLSVSGGGLSKSLHDNFIRELALFAHFGMPHSERAFNVQDRAKFGWRQEQQEKSPQVEERRLNLGVRFLKFCDGFLGCFHLLGNISRAPPGSKFHVEYP
jgi:hypothetical protein